MEFHCKKTTDNHILPSLEICFSCRPSTQRFASCNPDHASDDEATNASIQIKPFYSSPSCNSIISLRTTYPPSTSSSRARHPCQHSASRARRVWCSWQGHLGVACHCRLSSTSRLNCCTKNRLVLIKMNISSRTPQEQLQQRQQREEQKRRLSTVQKNLVCLSLVRSFISVTKACSCHPIAPLLTCFWGSWNSIRILP